MANLIDILSYENDVLRTYVFWSAVLVIKMLSMSILTGMKRHKNKVRNLKITKKNESS